LSQERESARLWGGRFTETVAPEADVLNRSLPIDRRLWREDVRAARAWAASLGDAGVHTAEEVATLDRGLEQVAVRLAAWSLAEWDAAPDEDIHTLVERILREEVGPVAGKLATGRSRNDQVATVTRMWALAAAERLDGALAGLQAALVDQAVRHTETVMPAYTHLQRAQPVSGAHWFLSHFWPVARDRARLGDAMGRVAVLPLGCGAIAGCPFPIDRNRLASVLGFAQPALNSMDAVADRDFVAELLFVAALVGSHLSRLGEDVVVYATAEFGFIRLPDRYSTGSSLMPQKRNPDMMELARGKAGRLTGELVGWLVAMKGLASGYNKDLQEDKAALFAAFDTLEALLPAVTGTIRELGLDVDRCARAVDAGMLTTDLADALVADGVPFRDAHEQVGRLVRLAESRGCALSEVPQADRLELSDALGRVDVAGVLDARASLQRRAAVGGTAPAAVDAQIRAARSALERA
jgi:argininosuccinate lyase